MHIQEAFNLLLEWRLVACKHAEEEIFAYFDYCLRNLDQSKAQLFQDLFVLFKLKNKERGFFVEVGASDGVALSNTYLLENKFRWKGILAEPAHLWAKELKKNRSCKLDFRCVWSESGKTLEFNETPGGMLSTISKFSDSDRYAADRKNGVKYQVETVSLNDLLKKHSAPKVIDYISLDTQGSEFDILNAFDFKAYDVKIFSVEHNHMPARERVYRLMQANGYERRLEILSSFDDWYVKKA